MDSPMMRNAIREQLDQCPLCDAPSSDALGLVRHYPRDGVCYVSTEHCETRAYPEGAPRKVVAPQIQVVGFPDT